MKWRNFLLWSPENFQDGRWTWSGAQPLLPRRLHVAAGVHRHGVWGRGWGQAEAGCGDCVFGSWHVNLEGWVWADLLMLSGMGQNFKPVLWGMYSFPRAALPKPHKPDGLKYRNVLFHSSGAQKSTIKVLAEYFPSAGAGEGSLLASSGLKCPCLTDGYPLLMSLHLIIPLSVSVSVSCLGRCPSHWIRDYH